MLVVYLSNGSQFRIVANGNFSFQKKRTVCNDTNNDDTMDDDDFPDTVLLDKTCRQVEDCAKIDMVKEEIQETRPPKKKRQRIVSYSILPLRFPLALY